MFNNDIYVLILVRLCEPPFGEKAVAKSMINAIQLRTVVDFKMSVQGPRLDILKSSPIANFSTHPAFSTQPTNFFLGTTPHYIYINVFLFCFRTRITAYVLQRLTGTLRGSRMQDV